MCSARMFKSAADIFSALGPVTELQGRSIADLEPYFDRHKPFIVRGLVKNWPMVQQAKQSGKAVRDYLLERAIDRPFMVSMGSDEFDGRIFYRDDMSMNIQAGRARLPLIFERIDQVENHEPLPIIYLGSIHIPSHFTGLLEDNPLDFGARKPRQSIWIGTRSRIAAHNDFPQNIACVVSGRRRFTFFPPEQFKNLYIGPIDNTPAGRAVSMVDFHKPDFERFPKFKDALEHGLTVILEPGDAVYIPSMWWHHVEGLDPFNILVNYWWRDEGSHLGQPQNALNHAIWAIRDLPDHEKQHWRDVFDHYVFENPDAVSAHIPEHGKGILGAMTEQNAGKIRSFLIKMLSNG